MYRFVFDQVHRAVHGVGKRGRAFRDDVEYRLEVARGTADEAQDLARRRLLLLRLNQLTVARLELPQRLRQACLQVADPGAVVRGRRAGKGGLRFLGLRRLWTPTHLPPRAPMNRPG